MLLTLEEAVQKAAKELPDGWQVCVLIERGSGSVELFAPDGTRIAPDFGGYKLSEQIEDLVIRAKVHAEALSGQSPVRKTVPS